MWPAVSLVVSRVVSGGEVSSRVCGLHIQAVSVLLLLSASEVSSRVVSDNRGAVNSGGVASCVASDTGGNGRKL